MSVVMALDKIAKGTMKGAIDLLSTLVGYFRFKLRDPSIRFINHFVNGLSLSAVPVVDRFK
jgi:hypothetical protein